MRRATAQGLMHGVQPMLLSRSFFQIALSLHISVRQVSWRRSSSTTLNLFVPCKTTRCPPDETCSTALTKGPRRSEPRRSFFRHHTHQGMSWTMEPGHVPHQVRDHGARACPTPTSGRARRRSRGHGSSPRRIFAARRAARGAQAALRTQACGGARRSRAGTQGRARLGGRAGPRRRLPNFGEVDSASGRETEAWRHNPHWRR